MTSKACQNTSAIFNIAESSRFLMFNDYATK